MFNFNKSITIRVSRGSVEITVPSVRILNETLAALRGKTFEFHSPEEAEEPKEEPTAKENTTTYVATAPMVSPVRATTEEERKAFEEEDLEVEQAPSRPFLHNVQGFKAAPTPPGSDLAVAPVQCINGRLDIRNTMRSIATGPINGYSVFTHQKHHSVTTTQRVVERETGSKLLLKRGKSRTSYRVTRVA